MSGSPASPTQELRGRGTPVPDHALDVRRVRQDFPILNQTVGGKPLIYLDNAASTQKPRAVIEALVRYYETSNANVHRGVHLLGDRATTAYEEARGSIQRFLNAASPQEIIFVRGATEGINLVAQSLGRQNLKPGDEVVITWMEHHANIVPWRRICDETGANLRVVPITDAGELRLDSYEKLLNPRTRIVAVTHVSNALGTVNPIRAMIEMAHAKGIPVLVDGAQAVSHMPVDVQELDCDFYAFSGHKVYGPMGIGVLYGKAAHLDAMPPWQGGGDMIETVGFEKITYNAAPNKFEAGTPNVADAVGLATALEYLDHLGRDAVAAHEAKLLESALSALRSIPGVRLIGEAKDHAGAVSFVLEDPPVSTYDVGTRLNLDGIAVRTGHHCCMPLMQRMGVSGTVRASFAVYNTMEEVEHLASVLEQITRTSTSLAPASASGSDDEESSQHELTYPGPQAPNIREAAAQMVEEFDLFDDWSERYQFLIELGEKLPFMPERMKTEANRVRGCQSIVFVETRTRPGTSDIVEFLADSDANLVRGLLALLQHLFSGQRAKEILDFDIQAFFSQIGLEKNLLTSRRNGLAEMVKRLRNYASSLLPSSHAVVPGQVPAAR